MDDGDPVNPSVQGRADPDLAPIHEYPAGIAFDVACQDLHQGRLACAVLPHQSMDLAGPQIEMDAIQRQRGAEAFGHILEPQERLLYHGRSSVESDGRRKPAVRGCFPAYQPA